jgi:hypothetical protein
MDVQYWAPSLGAGERHFGGASTAEIMLNGLSETTDPFELGRSPGTLASQLNGPDPVTPKCSANFPASAPCFRPRMQTSATFAMNSWASTLGVPWIQSVKPNRAEEISDFANAEIVL